MDRFEKSAIVFYQNGCNDCCDDLYTPLLTEFRKGLGYDITGFTLLKPNASDEHEKKVEGETQFRQQLVKSLFECTGFEPRLEQEGDKWMIYYF